MCARLLRSLRALILSLSLAHLLLSQIFVAIGAVYVRRQLLAQRDRNERDALVLDEESLEEALLLRLPGQTTSELTL